MGEKVSDNLSFKLIMAFHSQNQTLFVSILSYYQSRQSYKIFVKLKFFCVI